jgi:hypothetical protein
MEVRRVSVGSLKENVPRLVTCTATGRSTAHTKCRNEVKDLERSVELCGRAVADNENEAGNVFQS